MPKPQTVAELIARLQREDPGAEVSYLLLNNSTSDCREWSLVLR